MNTEIDPALTVALLNTQYTEIMGQSLDARIVRFIFSAGYALTERDVRSLLEFVPTAIVESLAQKITEQMKSPDVRDRLIEQKSKDTPEAPAADAYEYVLEVDPEPSIEFVDVDPETQAEILELMKDQNND